MLVARRDPPFESAAKDHVAIHAPPRSSRVLHGFQLIGSFLAIPIGLASAYSIYHTNFTTEARCETLRSNIVSMLDKNADPAALRMLVRRDVVTFESNCGSVDPDAVAAFRKLLAGSQVAAPQAKPEAKPEAKSAAKPQAAAPEPVRQQAQQPLPVKKPAAAEAKPAQPETTKSVRRESDVKPVRRDVEARPVAREPVQEKVDGDAAWLEAVRGALVHAPEGTAAKADNPRQPAPAPKPLGELRAPAAPVAAPSVAPSAGAPLVPSAAPALAPAASVAATPPAATEIDHPVPPASIPDGAPPVTASVPADKPERSRIKALIADIPLLGRMVDR